ncbi:uncharacterized protein LOC115763669 [Drosophila novamexicana]|uniref:uncharacterized protein LOC115763669 n=1 Tax=Drosophila novamexicana TaxID=47314 RepID=UPI0011E598BD|nr:uncharacterized protein LOC115763669 [Drosophila novamexicana]
MALDNDKLLATGDLFLPGLVQQVFHKYKRTNGTILTTAERTELFIELSALLGEDLLERALRLLDEWSFIIYYTADRLRSIAELSSKRNLAHVVRVVPGVNYCKCRYFQRCVLQLTDKEEGEEEEEEEQQEIDINKSNQVSFTCEHVLAQRLHWLVNLEPRAQILTLDQFRYFHNDFYED